MLVDRVTSRPGSTGLYPYSVVVDLHTRLASYSVLMIDKLDGTEDLSSQMKMMIKMLQTEERVPL